MNTSINTPTIPRWTASELRRLPEEERDAILSSQAEAARNDYLHDPELTGFDAFDSEVTHGEPSATPTR